MTFWKTAARARQTAEVLKILIILEKSYDFIYIMQCSPLPSVLRANHIRVVPSHWCELSVTCHLPAYTCFNHLSCHEVSALRLTCCRSSLLHATIPSGISRRLSAAYLATCSTVRVPTYSFRDRQQVIICSLEAEDV